MDGISLAEWFAVYVVIVISMDVFIYKSFLELSQKMIEKIRNLEQSKGTK